MNRLIWSRPLAAALLLTAVTASVGGENEGSRRDKAGVKAGVSCWAVIGTESPEFERGEKNPMILAGKPTDWTVVLWLNGDPMGFYTGGIWITPLAAGLRAGKNELTFSGKHDRPLYVVIATGRPDDSKSTVVSAKRKFSAPGAATRDTPLVFRAARAAKLPDRERLGKSPRERAIQEKEVRALVARLRKLIAGHKGRAAVRLLTEGLLLRAEAEGEKGPSREKLDEYTRKVSDPAAKVLKGDRPVRLLFGERAVLVYGRPPDRAGKDRSLFTVRCGRQNLSVGPLQLARVGGRWVIWDAN